MTAMMQWQVNRQFKKDHEVAIATIPNPDVVRAEALPVQEHEAPVLPEGPTPVQAPLNQPEPPPIP
ncbi:unnamed protein product [Prunus brigantina]